MWIPWIELLLLAMKEWVDVEGNNESLPNQMKGNNTLKLTSCCPTNLIHAQKDVWNIEDVVDVEGEIMRKRSGTEGSIWGGKKWKESEGGLKRRLEVRKRHDGVLSSMHCLTHFLHILLWSIWTKMLLGIWYVRTFCCVFVCSFYLSFYMSS